MDKKNTMSVSFGYREIADRWDLEIIPKFRKAITKTLKWVAMNE